MKDIKDSRNKMLQMTIEEKLENCIKDSKEWDELTEKLLKQENIKKMEDFPKLENGQPDVYYFLRAIYNNFFDYTKPDEIACGHFVFALKLKDCFSFETMLAASNELAYYKNSKNGEKIPVPIFKFSKNDLAMMHVIKEIMTRVNNKLNK